MGWGGSSLGERINDEVDFPLEGLDLSKHIIGAQNQSNLIYDCYAVSNHMGGVGGGHYTAYALNQSKGKWVEYDDSHVSEVRNPRNVISSAAYNLFYRKRDWHENNIKNGCDFDAMALKPDMSLINKK